MHESPRDEAYDEAGGQQACLDEVSQYGANDLRSYICPCFEEGDVARAHCGHCDGWVEMTTADVGCYIYCRECHA